LIYQINTKLKINIANLESFGRLKNTTKWRLIMYSLILLILISHLPYLNIYTIVYVAHLGLISTFYNVPEKSYKKSIFPLRSIPLLKVFLISYVWASISVVLPVVSHGDSLSSLSMLLFLMQFFFILSITLPFDIRDFRADYKKHIITTPHAIGINATKMLSLLSVLLFTAIFIYMTGLWNIIILTVMVAILIFFSAPKRKDHYYTLFMDGTIVLYFILVLLFNEADLSR
jgi:4-hydroxybenzoate polyprenyltransferase